jgi:parallel beta-helix repeat protein
LCVFASIIQSAKAVSGEIIINPDGSISSPVSANITTSDNVTYTFTGNNYLPIIVNRNNIIINGNGHTLQAPGQNGFSLTDVSNVTVENTTVTNSVDGIYLNSSSGDVLSRDSITANNIDGISLVSSSNNAISENNITGNTVGVQVDFRNNHISGNNITNNITFGVALYSSGNTVSQNTFTNDGLFVESIDNNVVGNSVNNKPLVYLEDVSNYDVSDAGQVVLVNCNGIIVNNLNLSNASVGVELFQTSNTRITNNDITNNRYGVFGDSSSVYSVLSENKIENDSITNNIADLDLSFFSNCTVSANNITNSLDGLALSYCSNSTVSGNNIINNKLHGIYLYYVSNSRFFHNNIINNTQQVYTYASTNAWDNGYPSGGNYWSDYQTRYPSATEIDSSGIWNTPYVIDSNDTDYYPLMEPYSPLALSVSISPSSVTLIVGQSKLFTSTVKGGRSPYSYHWYLNGLAVQDANDSTWIFMPARTGTYDIFLNVTDGAGTTEKSNIGQIIVTKVTLVGGVSASVNAFSFLSPWLSIISLLAAAVLLKGFIMRKKEDQFARSLRYSYSWRARVKFYALALSTTIRLYCSISIE